MGGLAYAEQPPLKQYHPGDCQQGSEFVIPANGWTFYASGPEADRVIDRLAAGDFLIGCEDEFPAPGSRAISVANQFGTGISIFDHAVNGQTDVTSLATLGEIPTSAHPVLAASYGFDAAWFDTLLSEQQGYFVAWMDYTDPFTELRVRKILVVGADRRALAYGAIDFVKSLDQVDFAGGGSWQPKDWQSGQQCTDYANTSCSTPAEPACWTAGTTRAWTAVDEATWCPAHVLNYPDSDVRIGWPTYEAGSFLGRVMNGDGAKCNSANDEDDWFRKRVVQCNKQAVGTQCNDSRIRLDALVWGKYSYAWDDSQAWWLSEELRENTSDETDTADPDGCDPSLAYLEVWKYLDERGVSLMPTLYGLEVANPEGPVEGELNTPNHYRGRYGDFALSEGLSVVRKRFEACDDGTGTYWLNGMDAPSYPMGDPSACTPLLDTDGDGAPDAGMLVERFTFESSADLTASTESGCRNGGVWAVCTDSEWSVQPVSSPWGDAIEPACTSPGSCSAFINVPVDGDTADRLYALGFDACIPDPEALDLTLLFFDGTGALERHDLTTPQSTTGAEGWDPGALIADTATPTSCDWGHMSFVFRVPDPATGVTSMGFRIRGEAGSDLALDNVQIVEVDSMLRNIDDGTVSYDASTDTKNSLIFEGLIPSTGSPTCGAELDPACFAVTSNVPATLTSDERGWSPFFDVTTGAVTDYLGSIEVIDTTCAELGNPTTTHDLTLEDVCVSCRSWTHAGMMPAASTPGQGIYAYTPDTYEEAFWEHDVGPRSQMDTLGGLGLAGVSQFDQFVVMSGGEIRGLNRAEDHEATSLDEKLASWTCGAQDAVCTGLEGWPLGCPSPGGGGTDCSAMFDDPLTVGPGATFAPCDCSTSMPDSGNRNRLIVPDENYTEWHVGHRSLYQAMYGGFEDASTAAREDIGQDAVFLTWWHHDSSKQTSLDGRAEVVGNEMMLGKAEDAHEAGFSSVGAAGTDPENARAWAAAIAGSSPASPHFGQDDKRIDVDLLGSAQFGWGEDEHAPLRMLQSGWYFWQSEWALLDTWYLVDEPSGPSWRQELGSPPEWTEAGAFGHTYVGRGFLLGGMPNGDDVALPVRGRRLENSTFTWASEQVNLDPVWATEQPGNALGGGSIDPDWAQVMLRFYARVNGSPPGCSVDVEFTFYSPTGPFVRPAVLRGGDCFDDRDNDGDGLPDLFDPQCVTSGFWEDGTPAGSDLVALSATASFSDLLVDDVEAVSVEVDVSGCDEGQQQFNFHNPSLYQGVPNFEWPWVYAEQTLEDWPDAKEDQCSQHTDYTTRSCNSLRTFEQP